LGLNRSFAVNTPATYDARIMPGYVLGHHLKGEGERLALMSELLDPMHRRYLESLDVVKSGAKHWKLAVAMAQFRRGWHGRSLQMGEP